MVGKKLDNNLLKKASSVKAGKRFASFIIDSIIVFIVSYFVFLGLFEITKNTESYKNDVSIVQTEIAYYNDFVASSHIVEFVDEDNNVRKDNIAMVLENLSRAIYLSYNIFGNNEYPDFVIAGGDTVTQFGEASLTSDSVSYFYSQFVPAHPEYNILNYGEKDPVEIIQEKYRESFGANQTMFVYDRLQSDIPVLKSSAAYHMHYYLFISQTDDIGKIGEQYYNAYFYAYAYMLEQGENLLLKSEPYYSEHYLTYQSSYFNQGRSVLITLLISLLIGNLLGILLPKIVFKNERSLGRKMLSIGTITNDEKNIPIWKVIVRHIIDIPCYVWVFLITMLFAPFNGVFDTLFMPLIPNANTPFALWMLIIVLIYSIANIVQLFTHRRQSLSDLIFGVIVKDKTHLDEGDNDDKYEGKPL